MVYAHLRVLYCCIPYYTALYYIALYCIILHYIILYCTVLHCITLYYTVLQCIILYYSVLYYIIMYYTVLHYITLYYTDLYCIILYYNVCMIAFCKCWNIKSINMTSRSRLCSFVKLQSINTSIYPRQTGSREQFFSYSKVTRVS